MIAIHPLAQLEYEYWESNREDIHATTIPLLEGMNLHAPIRMLGFVGAWPFLLVRLSLHVRCTPDMILGTQLRVVQVVVAILDPLRTVLSFLLVGVRYKLEIDNRLLCAEE